MNQQCFINQLNLIDGKLIDTIGVQAQEPIFLLLVGGEGNEGVGVYPGQ